METVNLAPLQINKLTVVCSNIYSETREHSLIKINVCPLQQQQQQKKKKTNELHKLTESTHILSVYLYRKLHSFRFLTYGSSWGQYYRNRVK